MSITYLTWTPEESYETQGTATDACSEVDRTLDEYREEGEGWPDTADSIAAFVAVPICVVEEVTDDDGGLEYDHRDVNAGLLAIIEERQRQIAKGWTPTHDALHDAGEIARAALVKLAIAALGGEVAQEIVGGLWPWEHTFGGDTSDPRKLLAEAGALIAAELDRLAAADAGGEK